MKKVYQAPELNIESFARDILTTSEPIEYSYTATEAWYGVATRCYWKIHGNGYKWEDAGTQEVYICAY